jgi:thiamine-phosphate pyrophosphorylase
MLTAFSPASGSGGVSDDMGASIADTGRRLKPSHGAKRRLLPRLIVMTDRALMPEPWAVIRHLPRGSLVILRDYDAPDRLDLALNWRRETRRRGILLVIGADPMLARAVKADGVHWPEALVAKIKRPGATGLITAAAHSGQALIRAAKAGVDLALVSPVFVTASHPGAKPLGIMGFRRLAHGAPLAVAALGGVNAQNARQLVHPRPAALAAIGAFIDSRI